MVMMLLAFMLTTTFGVLCIIAFVAMFVEDPPPDEDEDDSDPDGTDLHVPDVSDDTGEFLDGGRTLTQLRGE
jgi:hypothetical protein